METKFHPFFNSFYIKVTAFRHFSTSSEICLNRTPINPETFLNPIYLYQFLCIYMYLERSLVNSETCLKQTNFKVENMFGLYRFYFISYSMFLHRKFLIKLSDNSAVATINKLIAGCQFLYVYVVVSNRSFLY